MKKFLHLLVSCLVLSVFVAGCTAEMAEENVASVEQADHGDTCFVTAFSNSETVIPGGRRVNIRAMNLGTVSCPFKTSLDVYKNGVFLGGTAIQQHATLAPFTPGSVISPLIQHTFAYTGSNTCTYDIWWKYKPNYPSGSEIWHKQVQGPYNCF